jgi:hypothetical protein
MTITGQGLAAVFIAIDHCSAGCVGIHAAQHATRFEALEPTRQGVREHSRGQWLCRTLHPLARHRIRQC